MLLDAIGNANLASPCTYVSYTRYLRIYVVTKLKSFFYG